MHSDLTYAIYIVLAALVVGGITLGGTTYAYFAEERWGSSKPRSDAELAPAPTEPDHEATAREDHELAA